MKFNAVRVYFYHIQLVVVVESTVNKTYAMQERTAQLKNDQISTRFFFFENYDISLFVRPVFQNRSLGVRTHHQKRFRWIPHTAMHS